MVNESKKSNYLHLGIEKKHILVFLLLHWSKFDKAPLINDNRKWLNSTLE